MTMLRLPSVEPVEAEDDACAGCGPCVGRRDFFRIGLGATVASFLSASPWLVTLARHKAWVFALSGGLIASDFFCIYWLSPRLKAQGHSCSVADGPTACDTATRISRAALWVAAVIYAVGFFTAYLLGPILTRFSP